MLLILSFRGWLKSVHWLFYYRFYLQVIEALVVISIREKSLMFVFHGGGVWGVWCVRYGGGAGGGVWEYGMAEVLGWGWVFCI